MLPPQATSALPQVTIGAVRPEALTDQSVRQPGKTRLVAGKQSMAGAEMKAEASPAPTPSLLPNLEQLPPGSPIPPSDGAALEEAVKQSAILPTTMAHAPQILEVGEAIYPASAAVPAEKPLKAGVMSADIQTINNTRSLTALPQQTLLPPQPVAAAGRQEKPLVSDALVALPAAPVAPVASGKTEGLPPLSHAERAQIVKQTAEAVGAIRPPARPETPQQMTIQLHPKDWGKLQVSVTLAPSVQREAAPGQKAVTAHVIAETPQIKAALESQSGALRHALQSSGMHLDRLTVSVQSASHAEPTAASSGGSQPQTNLGSGSNGNGQPGGSAFASFAGNSPGGRQEQSPSYPAAASAELDDIAEPLTLRSIGRGQIDTRA